MKKSFGTHVGLTFVLDNYSKYFKDLHFSACGPGPDTATLFIPFGAVP